MKLGMRLTCVKRLIFASEHGRCLLALFLFELRLLVGFMVVVHQRRADRYFRLIQSRVQLGVSARGVQGFGRWEYFIGLLALLIN